MKKNKINIRTVAGDSIDNQNSTRKPSSNLYKKLDDSVVKRINDNLWEYLKLSSDTGDNDCTGSYPTYDCGDNSTDQTRDVNPTDKNDDSCSQ